MSSLIQKPFRYTQWNICYIFIACNVGVFLLTSIIPILFAYMALNPLLVTRKLFLWQIFTYQFVHGGITHLLLNMLFLFFFGRAVENQLGSSEFLSFYLFSGVGAGILSLIFYLITKTYFVNLVGASGALYGVLLAFAVFYPTATIHVWGIFPLTAKQLLLIYTAISVFSHFFGSSRSVAHLTHLAGFVSAYFYLRFRLGTDPIKRLFSR